MASIDPLYLSELVHTFTRLLHVSAHPMRLTVLLLLALAFAFLSACEPKDNSPASTTTLMTDSIDLNRAKDMVRQLPSPIEMAILVKHSGGAYDGTVLNPVKNIDRYTTEAEKTMNMGVFSADVGYTSLYKQTQETMFYLNNVRKLSDAIGLSEAFDQELFDRVEANIQCRDSLLNLLGGAYDRANEYLRANDRATTSLLMLAGGWVESVYLASRLGPDGKPTEEILIQIHAQRSVLDRMITAMDALDDPAVNDLHMRMLPLQKMMQNEGLVTGEGENAKVDPSKFEPILTSIGDIRAWIIS